MSFQGIGEALVVGKNCQKLVQFTSSAKIISTESDDLFIIEYKNSFIGSKRLSLSLENSFIPIYVGSNITNNIYITSLIDDESNYYIFVTLNGMNKKCNFASEDLQILLPSATSSKLFSETLKKNSKGPEEFKKLLTEKPNLKKKYLQLKAKLGK
jgi:hypothetical protein